MLSRQQELDTEFFTPRTYQLELVEKAKKHNLIVPLGTGVGKTFIAVMLMREMAAEVRLPLDRGGKRSFFLVNTVPLVSQQAKHIEDCADLKVGQYHGHKNVDLWDEAKWNHELNTHHVMVMTAEIFKNMLNHGLFSLKKANLLVFDECHHATKSHPYAGIMESYNQLSASDYRPRILGLTASVINETVPVQRLEEYMKILERVLQAKIETASDLTSLAKYGAKPQILVISCHDFQDPTGLAKSVEYLLNGALKFIRSSDFTAVFDLEPTKPAEEAIGRTLKILHQLGPWCTWKVAQIQERMLAKQLKYMMTPWQRRYLLLGQSYMRAVRQILAPHMKSVKSVEDVLKFTPDKVNRLLEALKIYKSESKKEGKERGNRNRDPSTEFSGIVFVEQRYVAFILQVLLKNIRRWDMANFGFLKLDFVVGFSGYSIPTEDQQSLQKRQEEVLRNFRQKQLNLIIATSVLEEGVDVRQCNCVIRFDRPKEYRSYVQSKGRARKAGSRFFLLVESQDLSKAQNDLSNFQAIEKVLLKYCRNRENPEAVEIADKSLLDQLVPPYIPEIPAGVHMEGIPRVTMATAIALVNRYCSKLPSDIFTRLVPRTEIESISKNGLSLYQAKLLLPINSPVKEEMVGLEMPNKKYAQMAVALKVCEELHRRGELNHHLLPVGKEALWQEILQDEDDSDEVWPTDKNAPPGSTKRRQYYDKKLATLLRMPIPVAEKPVYVHLIEFQLTSPADHTVNIKNRPIIDPADCPQCFGLLGSKVLPVIPNFPLYTRQGGVMVTARTLDNQLTVNQSQLDQIALFHRYLFSDLLRLEKFSMKWDPAKCENASYVIPMKKENGEHVLDWRFIVDIVGSISDLPRTPKEDERKNFVFNKDKYKDAIVMPWYRNKQQPHFYYVARICDYLSPASPFPDSEYGSFNAYFKEKYGLTIFNQDQPLLDVDHTSSRLNLLTPRNVKRAAVVPEPQEGGDVSTEKEKQILVPELVDTHPIPASLWNLIVCLPSVLYRLNQLLLADEWRQKVEEEAFSRTVTAVPTGHWEPLEIEWNKNLESYVNAMGLEKQGPTAAVKKQPNLPKCDDVDHSFDIGYWDPDTVVDESLLNGALQNDQANDSLEDIDRDADELPAEKDQEVEDSVVGGNGEPGDGGDMPAGPAGVIGVAAGHYITGDDDEDEDVWEMEMEMAEPLFNLEPKSRFMKEFGLINPEEEEAQVDEATRKRLDGLLATRTDIEPTGWDAPPMAEINPETHIAGVQFISAGGQPFDHSALLQDIAYDELSTHGVQRPQNGMVPVRVPPVADDLEELPVVIDARDNLTQNGTATTGLGGGDEFDTTDFDPLEMIDFVEDGVGTAKTPAGQSAGPSTSSAPTSQPFVTEEKDLIDFDDADPRREEDLISFEDINELRNSWSTGVTNSSLDNPDLAGPFDLPAGVTMVTDDFDLSTLVGVVPAPVHPKAEEAFSSRSSSVSIDDSFAREALSVLEFDETYSNSGLINSCFCKKEKRPTIAYDSDMRLEKPYGPSPCLILQSVTMSSANDGFSLERLETVGDSFIKYAITVHLFNVHADRHEGKLSYMRSKQVSNYNLYKLGKRKGLGELLVGSKFEPTDNWLPPGFAPMEARAENQGADEADRLMEEEIENSESRVTEEVEEEPDSEEKAEPSEQELANRPEGWHPDRYLAVPFHLLTQQSIPDKSIADAVEALIGAYLLFYGPKGAMQFMQWLGLQVLPKGEDNFAAPREPLLNFVRNPVDQLTHLYVTHNFVAIEETIGYRFQKKAFLVQAFTHASYFPNRVTDCYQRLEFLGDAVLDYLITRYLYEDPKKHSPGILTDLRSALVNNTIFASLAVKYNFHKYFLAICPQLTTVMEKFVTLQGMLQTDLNFQNELYYLKAEEEGDEDDEEEDIEVPKALGDIFESVAGAVFLDSGYSLDIVWKVFYRLMKSQLEECCANPPKSPIRELLELEPETAKFSKPKRLATRGKVSVSVEVYNKGLFTGTGRSYRLAKCTAAKRALKYLKGLGNQRKRERELADKEEANTSEQA